MHPSWRMCLAGGVEEQGMKQLDMIENRIKKGEVTEINIVADTFKAGEILEEYLKKRFANYKLWYRIITRSRTADGINYNTSATILWGSWWKNEDMLGYVKTIVRYMPGVRAIGDIDPEWDKEE